MKEPRIKNGIEVADKSIRDVPLGPWMKFVGDNISKGRTVTEGIMKALDLYFEKEGVK